MILALVGSRHFTDYKLFKRTVLNFLCKHNDSQFPSEIVSGGARGADRLAVQFAAEFDVPLKEYEPELSATSRSGKMEFARAARARNELIVQRATHMVAFPDPQSRGTRMSIAMARRQNLVLEVREIKANEKS